MTVKICFKGEEYEVKLGSQSRLKQVSTGAGGTRQKVPRAAVRAVLKKQEPDVQKSYLAP